MASRRDPVGVPRVLVDPGHLEPMTRVTVVRRNEMKILRVGTLGMAKCLYVTGQQEIERLDLFRVGLTLVQSGQRPDYGRTANRHATNSGPIFKCQAPCRQLQRFSHHIEPGLPNPFAILAVGIGRIQRLAKAMLGPSICLIVVPFTE